ncbi:MAG: tRNA 2-thiouridine(34) synthase MnmA, partial [Saprospiraceae bacterium]|nr:tRNA 2-thiouridine(34) synthase MnmA [Saprospiraceae bacterium]
KVIAQGADELEISFNANVRGIAPGQSAVVYDGADVIAGGIIKKK